MSKLNTYVVARVSGTKNRPGPIVVVLERYADQLPQDLHKDSVTNVNARDHGHAIEVYRGSNYDPFGSR